MVYVKPFELFLYAKCALQLNLSLPRRGQLQVKLNVFVVLVYFADCNTDRETHFVVVV